MKKIANGFLHPFSFVVLCLGLTSAPCAFGMENAEPRERPSVVFLQTLEIRATTAEAQVERCMGKLQASKEALENAATALTRLAAEKKDEEEKNQFLQFMLESIVISNKQRKAFALALENADKFYAEKKKTPPKVVRDEFSTLLAKLSAPIPDETLPILDLVAFDIDEFLNDDQNKEKGDAGPPAAPMPPSAEDLEAEEAIKLSRALRAEDDS